MALTNAELQRVRFELGYPNLDTAAEPYIGITSVFTQIIKPYLLGGVSTTSTTAVSASIAPSPQTLTLTNATGLAVGDVVIVDVDSRQERATIQALHGLSMTVLLSLEHSGTYAVVQEGAEAIVRDILWELRRISDALVDQKTKVGLKQVDDVQFFGGGSTLAAQGLDPLSQILKLREYWRDELANCLGIPRLNSKAAAGGSEIGVY